MRYIFSNIKITNILIGMITFAGLISCEPYYAVSYQNRQAVPTDTNPSAGYYENYFGEKVAEIDLDLQQESSNLDSTAYTKQAAATNETPPNQNQSTSHIAIYTRPIGWNLGWNANWGWNSAWGWGWNNWYGPRWGWRANWGWNTWYGNAWCPPVYGFRYRNRWRANRYWHNRGYSSFYRPRYNRSRRVYSPRNRASYWRGRAAASYSRSRSARYGTPYRNRSRYRSSGPTSRGRSRSRSPQNNVRYRGTSSRNYSRSRGGYSRGRSSSPKSYSGNRGRSR